MNLNDEQTNGVWSFDFTIIRMFKFKVGVENIRATEGLTCMYGDFFKTITNCSGTKICVIKLVNML